jgi:hypothetical protein
MNGTRKKLRSLVLLVFLLSTLGLAQMPQTMLRVVHSTHNDDTTFTFELWFKNLSADSLQYCTGQFYWDLNNRHFKDSAVTVSILSSGLPSILQPRNPLYATAATPFQLRFASNPAPGAGNGFWIHSNDSVLIMKSKLVCRSGFALAESMNLAFRHDFTDLPATKIDAYIGAVNVNIMAGCTLINEFPVVIPTGIAANETKTKPTVFSLAQNYPNPFNPASVIRYAIPVQSTVLIKVYNALGREVRTLVNETKEAGNYSVSFNAANLPSGIYFYTLHAGSYSMTKKMLLIK